MAVMPIYCGRPWRKVQALGESSPRQVFQKNLISSATFVLSATPRSLRIRPTERDRLQPGPLRTCDGHLAALSHAYATQELKLDSNKANLTAEWHRLDNPRVASKPWRPCNNLCFFSEC